MTSSAIVQKLWNYCNILRDDGLSYGDYSSAQSILSAAEGLRRGSEQLTFLVFFTCALFAGRKMADERTCRWLEVACVAAQAGRFGK